MSAPDILRRFGRSPDEPAVALMCERKLIPLV
jgi:hypothetical protein